MSTDTQWPFGTQASEIEKAARRTDLALGSLAATIDVRMTERSLLLAMLKRTTGLLSSARLVITDDTARQTATNTVNEAQALIRRCEGK